MLQLLMIPFGRQNIKKSVRFTLKLEFLVVHSRCDVWKLHDCASQSSPHFDLGGLSLIFGAFSLSKGHQNSYCF